MTLSRYQRYLQDASKPIDKNYPIKIQQDSYKVDGCGSPIDENGDYLKGNYNTFYHTINNESELDKMFCSCNPHGHYRFIQL